MPGKQNGVQNGIGAGGSSFANFDPDDPEYIRDLQRPAAIKEDLNEMERRKRVHQILDSKNFCKELEDLIKQETSSTENDPEHLKRLQRLSELTLPHGQLAATTLQRLGSSSIAPIADLRGIDRYTKQEKILRNKLAALYRLVDLFQWSQGIYNHITLRISGDADEVYVNPFGLLYSEVTAGSLVKVNLDGEVIDGGSTKLGINRPAFLIHSAIHRARPDIRCVLHMHTAVVGAVSSMKCGLLPICQEALVIGPVSYHDYQAVTDEDEQRQAIAQDLGPTNKVMLLRNRGFVTCGESVEETLHLARNVVLACETQIRAARAGLENLDIPDERTRERAYRAAQKNASTVVMSPKRGENGGKSIEWRIGELEWEAWMRVLDNAGFRTGHVYKQPSLRNRNVGAAAVDGLAQLDDNVAVPPSASSVGAVDESDPESVTARRIALLRREQDRSKWLNSPNAYQKVEVLETGTDNPKVITKWVAESTSPTHSTPIKITSPHQFSPFSVNPKEFKDKQKAIKENRRAGATTAGPQSQILDGVTYEDIAHMRDAEESALGYQERVVMIGTASKGIIDRPYQHNAQVYRQLYAPNPFASETDDDIQKYMKEIEAKTSPRPMSGQPLSSSVDDSRPAASPPPDETESPSAETVSLMQAAREHRSRQDKRKGLQNASASIEEVPDDTISSDIAKNSAAGITSLTRETTFDEKNQTSTKLVPTAPSHPSSIGGLFSRSKSERFPARSAHDREHADGKAEPKAASDDEREGGKEKKKKKKRGFFSFGRKKNK